MSRMQTFRISFTVSFDQEVADDVFLDRHATFPRRVPVKR